MLGLGLDLGLWWLNLEVRGVRVSASSCTQSGAAAVSQKATFSQNQPNNLKLMALTVVPTKTPAMLEHGFKLCMFVGVACRYLLQDHRDPPQRNKLSPKTSQSETVLRRKMFNWAFRNSQTSLSAFLDPMYTLLITTASFIHVTCR